MARQVKWSGARVLAAVALPVWAADFMTKVLAQANLRPPHTPHRVVGETVRLTLAYNQQGVMGLPVGAHGRWVLSGVSIVLLALLLRLLHTTPVQHRLRAASLAVIIGGALGNLMDRLMSGRGVVDFIDVGLGAWRFWTFNLADVAIDVGVVLFAWSLWRDARTTPSVEGRDMPWHETFNNSRLSRFINSPAGRAFRVVAGLAFLVVGFLFRARLLGVASMVWGVLPLTAGGFDVCYISAALGGPLSGARIRALQSAGHLQGVSRHELRSTTESH